MVLGKMIKHYGFSLIELMIAVLIVAILASISYPAYQQYVLRSYRAEAVQTLLTLANAQEQHFADYGVYQADISQLQGISELTASGFTTSGRYRVSLGLIDVASGFTALATATGLQAADNECLSFQLNHYGQRNVDNGVAQSCWR
jgi:type IV pilus assembly protein PilE